MKINKSTIKRQCYFWISFCFTAVVPLVLTLVQFATINSAQGATQFRISAIGIMLAILIFWSVKKLYIDKQIQRLAANAANAETLYLIESDSDKKRILKSEIRFVRTLEVCVNAVLPLAIMTLAIVSIRAIEAQLIALSGTLGFILCSYFLGVCFSVLHAREIKGGTK